MITILLAAYNGERFLAEQLDSLLRQTEQGFIVRICDDCSTDGTYKIAEKYAAQFPDKIFISRNAQNSKSAKTNFYQMMLSYRDQYIMLCDQDDVWEPKKIELTLKKMKSMEKHDGEDTPLLVHTDLRVVDQNLNVISRSFKYMMNANYDRVQLKDALIQNILTGCTVMYNRALSDLIIGEPSYMVMHDWWLMLLAAAFGRIGHIEEQTIQYRQHGNNDIGAKNVRSASYKVDRLLHGKQVREALNQTYRQAEAFLTLYRQQLPENKVKLLETYCTIPKLDKWHRWKTICRLGVLKNGIARKIANLIFI